MDLLIVGEALVDLVTTVDGATTAAPGGSPANVALALGRLGLRPRLLTRLGDDEYGTQVRDWLVESGVLIDPLSRGAARTAVAEARLDRSGAASYRFDIVWDPPPAVADLAADPAAPVDLLHVGSIGAFLPPGGAVVEALVDRRSTRTLASYDPNIRPTLVTDPAGTRDRVLRLVAAADIVKVSDEDVAWLAPDRDPLVVAGEWLGWNHHRPGHLDHPGDRRDHPGDFDRDDLGGGGPSLVVVTRGAAGAVALTPTVRVDVPARPGPVVDTVGAGDTVAGALLAALVTRTAVLSEPTGRRRRARLGALTADELADLVRYALAAAAITVSRVGADPPWAAELRDRCPELRTPAVPDGASATAGVPADGRSPR